MTSHVLDLDTQAILLLCGSFGQPRAGEYKPLNLREYNQVAQWLNERGLRPGNLINLDQIDTNDLPKNYTERLQYLLSRGAAMALAVEGWANKGIWLTSRIEKDYPDPLRERLKRSAPPILYGVGNQELLDKKGLAIIGSRNVGEIGLHFTRRLASQCARQDIQVISGGARGVDSEAMETALESGGSVLGVLAHSLSRAAVLGKYRDYLLNGNLVLISPYDPDAGFSVGTAMGRNKYIYCNSDWALVISSGFKKGGTWSGAQENLKHQWVPLYVRSGESIPKGNKELLKLGGREMPESLVENETDLRNWLTKYNAQEDDPNNRDQSQQLSLFPNQE